MSGHLSGIDWAAKRDELGIAEGEKLYGGFDTGQPEVYVVPHHQRKLPGTPVWVDGRQLERRLYLTDAGDIMTRDEVLARWVEVAPKLPEGIDTVDAMNSWVAAGASVYDRGDSEGMQELALNILADTFNEEVARHHYKDFAEEVVNRLPRADHVELAWYEQPDASVPHAIWFLRENTIREWLE